MGAVLKLKQVDFILRGETESRDLLGQAFLGAILGAMIQTWLF